MKGTHSCDRCAANFRQILRTRDPPINHVATQETEAEARERHQSSCACVARTLWNRLHLLGFAPVGSHSRALKSAGLPVFYRHTSYNTEYQADGTNVTRFAKSPWAWEGARDAAWLVSKSGATSTQRRWMVRLLYRDHMLRDSMQTVHRLGGPKAVLKYLLTEHAP